MPRLIDAERPTARQRKLREQTPALVLHRATGDLALLHLRNERLDIVAHEIELVHVVLVGRMHRNLRRRQSEDEPSVAHIDVRQLEHVAQESAVGIRVRAVDNRMRSDDHGRPPLILDLGRCQAV